MVVWLWTVVPVPQGLCDEGLLVRIAAGWAVHGAGTLQETTGHKDTITSVANSCLQDAVCRFLLLCPTVFQQTLDELKQLVMGPLKDMGPKLAPVVSN